MIGVQFDLYVQRDILRPLYHKFRSPPAMSMGVLKTVTKQVPW
jgi:hypothetical protein